MIGASPKAGEQVPYASAVTLKVSLGPEVLPGAELHRADSAPQAEERAAEYGLRTSFTDLPGGTGVVITQSPAPGITVTYGDTISALPAVSPGAAHGSSSALGPSW